VISTARSGSRGRRRSLRVAARGRRRRPVRHQHAQQLVRPDRLGDEVRHERRIDPAGQPEHAALEARLAQLAADEPGDDPARDVGVDRELVGQLEQRRPRRRRQRSPSLIGRDRSRIGLAAVAARSAPSRRAANVEGRDVEARLLRQALRRRVDRHARPARR
jgi:hypothetical protein